MQFCQPFIKPRTIMPVRLAVAAVSYGPKRESFQRSKPRGDNAEYGGTKGAPLTLAVTGGKGGVGKPRLRSIWRSYFAKQGYRTLLLDGDAELANVNVMLGVYPGMTLEHVVLGERTLDEVLLPVTENLDLLPGASGVPGCLEMGIGIVRIFWKTWPTWSSDTTGSLLTRQPVSPARLCTWWPQRTLLRLS